MSFMSATLSSADCLLLFTVPRARILERHRRLG